MSSLLIAVDFSSARAISAPLAGSCGVDGEAQPRVRVGASGEIADRGELPHQLGELASIELTDVAPILRQLTRTGVRFLEERVDARFRIAVDERLDVPRDVGRGPVSFCSGHELKLVSRAMGTARALPAAARSARPRGCAWHA